MGLYTFYTLLQQVFPVIGWDNDAGSVKILPKRLLSSLQTTSIAGFKPAVVIEKPAFLPPRG
ncbi:hypothetical protein D3C76_1726820 [compost metagenome]